MSTHQSLLVPLDFSPISDAALVRAISLGQLFDAKLHLLHALVPLSRFGYRHEFASLANWEQERAHLQAELEKVEQQVRDTGLEVTTSLVEDHPVHAIADAAEAHKASMIVMGTHGFSGVRRVVLGSVAEAVLRTLHIPVVAVKGVKEVQSQPIRNIVLATDFSEQSESAARFCRKLAEQARATVEIVHAIDFANAVAPYGVPLGTEHLIAARSAATEKLTKIRESFEGEASIHLDEGGAPYVITGRAQQLGADVIVIGTHGFTGFKHVLMGSVAERVLRLSHCTVIAVRH